MLFNWLYCLFGNFELMKKKIYFMLIIFYFFFFYFDFFFFNLYFSIRRTESLTFFKWYSWIFAVFNHFGLLAEKRNFIHFWLSFAFLFWTEKPTFMEMEDLFMFFKIYLQPWLLFHSNTEMWQFRKQVNGSIFIRNNLVTDSTFSIDSLHQLTWIRTMKS